MMPAGARGRWRLAAIRTPVSALVSGAAAVALIISCAGAPKYDSQDCPTFSDLDVIRVNPAGALDRHLRVEASFRICPPEEGLAEIRRKRIELKHELIALLSAKTVAELEVPLRTEILRREIQKMVNAKVLKRGVVDEVYITELELE